MLEENDTYYDMQGFRANAITTNFVSTMVTTFRRLGGPLSGEDI